MIAAMYIGRVVGLTRVAAGPYAVIFASLWQYHKEVPVTVRVRILGVALSDKIFLYLLSTQVSNLCWCILYLYLFFGGGNSCKNCSCSGHPSQHH